MHLNAFTKIIALTHDKRRGYTLLQIGGAMLFQVANQEH